MTKNQNEKDTRQILIESSEFLSKVKLSKSLKEAVQMSAGKAGTLIVKNIPCTILNRINQNGRIYTTRVVQAAIDEAVQLNCFESKQLLSQACEHPEGSFVSPTTASHVVIASYIKKDIEIVVEGKKGRFDVLFQDWEVLNTEEGKNLRALFEAECSIGTSIRGVGDMNGKYVENYSLLGCDCVGNPSSSTFTRMPVSESVKVELVDPRELKETFTVATSSTNVVRDLEKAAVLQARLDDIGYGTVTKTSTKLDSEVDPKTGAETTITTLEAETEDEVSDIDQALAMAKNAMLNGTVNIDSITITKNEEEEPKESVEEAGEYVAEEDLTEEALRVSLDYKLTGYGYEVSLKGSPENLRYIKKNLPQPMSGAYTTFGPYNTENHDVKVLEFAYPFDEAELNNLLSTLQNNMHVRITESLMTEAKKEEDPKAGKKFVLKCPAGFVSMDGNALVFKENPEEALHFIVGKEESGLVHLSGVEKILDTMGVYDVEKYYRKEVTDISEPAEENIEEGLVGGLIGGTAGALVGNAVAGPLGALGGAASGYSLGSNIGDDLSDKEESIKEDNGSATKFVAQVSIIKEDGIPETSTVPVSGVELSSVINEVSNLWKQKADNEEGQVEVKVIDTTTNDQYIYNPDSNQLDLAEASGEIEQKDNSLSLELDDNTTVEKDFDSTAQASVVKAGMEQGKLDGSIMLSEDETSTGSTRCDWCGNNYPSEQIKKVENLGRLCFGCRQKLRQRGHSISFVNEAAPEYEDIQPGWYIGAQDIGVVGPFASKEEALSDLGDIAEFVNVEYISPEDLKKVESSDMNEVLFKNPSDASDPDVELPLNDATEEDDEFERTEKCVWCKEEFPVSELRNEKDLGKICYHCAHGLESREGPLDFEEASSSDEMEITLYDIDWDVEDIKNKFRENALPDDVATEGDLLSLINNLPTEVKATLNYADFKHLNSPEEFKRAVIDFMSDKVGLKINNAKGIVS